ncbi:MAG: hypothetical protein ACE15F_14115 [bacterium]
MKFRTFAMIGLLAAIRFQTPYPAQAQDWDIQSDPAGRIVSVSGDSAAAQSIQINEKNTPRLQFADEEIICGEPSDIQITEDAKIYHYQLNRGGQRLDLEYEIRPIETAGGAGIQQTVTLIPHDTLQEDFSLLLPFAFRVKEGINSLFLPMKNGMGVTAAIEAAFPKYVYYLTGKKPESLESVLAIPLFDIVQADGSTRLSFISDPYLTMVFLTPKPNETGAFISRYEASRVRLSPREKRVFYTIFHKGEAQQSLQAFYSTALADIPPGPEWLHDIAMIGYDYLSDGGQGWFQDIDWLTERLPEKDRNQVCLALHGWYDVLGRYTYDPSRKKLDEAWVAFPNAPHCDKKVFPNSVSVNMTQEEVRKRLRYAKDRGFRVVLYFADGMAICEGAKGIFTPDRILYSGGWQGPDTIGPTHIQNPLHPKVYEFYQEYMDALWQAYGNDLDGLVWDETFHVDPGHLGTPDFPGYAARAMMELVKDLAARVHRFRADCVFLASDCLGAGNWFFKAPYALAADGTYQDSHCQPAAWPYGLFPNRRNVLWSCNWNPVTRFGWTEYGVKNFQVPVVFTNGWNDDMGFYEMPPATAQRFLQLFQERKDQKTRLQWLTQPPKPFEG